MDPYGLAASGERDGLWDWDLVSNRVHFSPRWISMVGCEDGEVGNSPEEWLRRVHAEDQARVRREIETHVAGGARDFDIDHRMLQRNGTYHRMTCRGVVVRDDNGAAVRMVGSHADVTGDHVADPLTGLPNRVLFLDRLTRSIDRATRIPSTQSSSLNWTGRPCRAARAARHRGRHRERSRVGPDPVAAVRVRAGILLLQAG